MLLPPGIRISHRHGRHHQHRVGQDGRALANVHEDERDVLPTRPGVLRNALAAVVAAEKGRGSHRETSHMAASPHLAQPWALLRSGWRPGYRNGFSDSASWSRAAHYHGTSGWLGGLSGRFDCQRGPSTHFDRGAAIRSRRPGAGLCPTRKPSPGGRDRDQQAQTGDASGS